MALFHVLMSRVLFKRMGVGMEGLFFFLVWSYICPYVLTCLCYNRELTSEWEATRIEALHWIATLLARHRAEVHHFQAL